MATNWLKKGKAVEAAKEEEEQKQAQRQAANNKPWWFRIKDGEEATITFLDGQLNEDGVLDCIAFYGHTVNEGGRWRNYVCIEDPEEGVSCPICENGNNNALHYALTCIVHTEYKDKSGNVVKNPKRLFVFKTATHKILHKLATKRKGLAGITFDVSREGAMSASCGNMFDFSEKMTAAQLAKAFGDVAPYDYAEALPYVDEKGLRDMGYGITGVGSVSHQSGSDDSDDDDNKYKQEL